jgi:hypothetical protein
MLPNKAAAAGNNNKAAATEKQVYDAGRRFGTCITPAAATIKDVTIAAGDFILAQGVSVIANFTETSMSAYPGLNINDTGVKYIYYNGTYAAADMLKANRFYQFVYDGTYYQLVGGYTDSADTYMPISGGTFTGVVNVPTPALPS